MEVRNNFLYIVAFLMAEFKNRYWIRCVITSLLFFIPWFGRVLLLDSVVMLKMQQAVVKKWKIWGFHCCFLHGFICQMSLYYLSFLLYVHYNLPMGWLCFWEYRWWAVPHQYQLPHHTAAAVYKSQAWTARIR